MKLKTFLCVVITFVFSQTVFGQLKVSENGSIFMGELTPFSGGFLNIGSASKVGIDIRPEIQTAWGDVVRVTMKKIGIGAFVVRNRDFWNTGGMTTDIVFQVLGDGKIFTRGQYLTPSATAASVNKSRSLLSLNSSVVDRLRQLNAVSYQPEVTKNARAASAISLDSISEPLQEIELQMSEENKREKVGFLAQELEEVFPNVVYTLPTGDKAIAYTELIPILVEAIKEQQTRIESLETLLSDSNMASPKKANTGNSDSSQNMKDAMLYPNTPNPFNEETTISYRLSANAGTAAICIYDLNGRQLKSYALDVNTISGEVKISASELISGMYIYALIIDNQVIDSKRMTLTGNN